MIQQQAHPPFWPASVRGCVGGLLLTTMLLLVACGQRATGQPQQYAASAAQEPGETPTPTIDIYAEYSDPTVIARLEESLRNPQWTAEERQRIERGLADTRRRAQERATIMADGATRLRAGDSGYTTPVLPVAPTPYPTGTPGIFPVRVWTELLADYTFATGWRGDEPDGSVTLYAGFLNADPQQGVVVELKDLYEQIVPQTARYDTPTRSGSVRIIAEQNGQLTLEAENGDLFVFDVAAREFVDDPPAPTPTVDPDAIPTPTGSPEAAGT